MSAEFLGCHSCGVHYGPQLRVNGRLYCRECGLRLDELLETISRLEPDAVRVLTLTAKRLAMGRKQYGELVLATDLRDFTEQALEESLDLSAYLAMWLVKDAAKGGAER